MIALRSRRIPTIRSRLALLVVACMVPAAMMVVGLLLVDYQRDRGRLVRDAIATARAMTTALDRELAGAQSALFALATSPHLASDDLGAFYAQANQVLPNLIAHNIVLIDADGRQQINTLVEFGETLPAETPPQLRRIFETGRPVVTDLYIGPVFGSPVAAVGVPVFRDKSVLYSLSAGIMPARLVGILTQQRLPVGWPTAIVDSTGSVVARTHEMARFLGKQGHPAFVKRIGEVSEDSLETVTLEGVPVLSVFSRSAVSNWTVVIGMPLRDLTVSLWNTLRWLILGLMALILGSLGLAWAIGGRISRSVHALSKPALALGFGEAVTVPVFHLKEADEVGQALVKASQMLRDARHQAHHDALTGLANRALFCDIVNHHTAICSRTGVPLALLYLDLDGFKAVNDTHGHGIGDELLRAVASRLREQIRSSDLAARLGGDEFAVVLVNTDGKGAVIVADKLRECVARAYPIGQLTIAISVSVGIAEYPQSGTTCDALLRGADEAMYRDKSAGGVSQVAVAG